jgi:hypothetical protein
MLDLGQIYVKYMFEISHAHDVSQCESVEQNLLMESTTCFMHA